MPSPEPRKILREFLNPDGILRGWHLYARDHQPTLYDAQSVMDAHNRGAYDAQSGCYGALPPGSRNECAQVFQEILHDLGQRGTIPNSLTPQACRMDDPRYLDAILRNHHNAAQEARSLSEVFSNQHDRYFALNLLLHGGDPFIKPKPREFILNLASCVEHFTSIVECPEGFLDFVHDLCCHFGDHRSPSPSPRMTNYLANMILTKERIPAIQPFITMARRHGGEPLDALRIQVATYIAQTGDDNPLLAEVF